MISVGDQVMLIVKFPDFGWGDVTPDEIGVVVGVDLIDNGEEDLAMVFVDFPNHSDWEGWSDEVAVINPRKSIPPHIKYLPIV